jgi:hypothetical protein
VSLLVQVVHHDRTSTNTKESTTKGGVGIVHLTKDRNHYILMRDREEFDLIFLKRKFQTKPKPRCFRHTLPPVWTQLHAENITKYYNVQF